MEQVDARSEPEPELPPDEPIDGGDGPPPQEPSRAPLVAIAIVALLAVVGLVAWLIGRDDGELSPPEEGGAASTEAAATSVGEDELITVVPVVPVEPSVAPTAIAASTIPPTEPLVTEPPTTGSLETAPPATGVPATTAIAPPATVPPGTVPPPVVPPPATVAPAPDGPAATIGEIVPDLAAFADFRPDALATRVAELLAAPRHDVASPTPVATLCAVVPLAGTIELSGRWELDGRPYSSSNPAVLGPPGFGDCIDDDGDELPDGAYQFIATDADGEESAVGTFVAGAARLEQRFVNDGDDDVCAILVGPASADYYDAFSFPGTIGPGEEVTIPLADVRQDVRTVGCDDAVLDSFRFDPSPGEAQQLRT